MPDPSLTFFTPHFDTPFQGQLLSFRAQPGFPSPADDYLEGPKPAPAVPP